ncbi:hypothetical protein NC652_031990 [Populus alba x Populus x berolinensis]|uniref:Uncharacterized protein n=1 Tax=Populus alba x Populus x berolinensis TaxID=444605 RepID=A0AAD6M0G4_9ROSI|nr:hypothetical protein NC652_031990 [Populus alba x Populus x berolinensis]KAJ6976109.1 hypothetical protein NC653_031824 [Populus alba x Populus x berolinensis]
MQPLENEFFCFDLDIPESVGLTAPLPASSSPRLLDLDSLDNRRREKRKL